MCVLHFPSASKRANINWLTPETLMTRMQFRFIPPSHFTKLQIARFRAKDADACGDVDREANLLSSLKSYAWLDFCPAAFANIVPTFPAHLKLKVVNSSWRMFLWLYMIYVEGDCHSVLQGVSRLVCKLCLLISWTYVNIMEYPFNHLITLVGDFVRGMKHHETWNDASENCRTCFWCFFSIFGDFLPTFEDFQPIWALITYSNKRKNQALISLYY